MRSVAEAVRIPSVAASMAFPTDRPSGEFMSPDRWWRLGMCLGVTRAARVLWHWTSPDFQSCFGPCGRVEGALSENGLT